MNIRSPRFSWRGIFAASVLATSVVMCMQNMDSLTLATIPLCIIYFLRFDDINKRIGVKKHLAIYVGIIFLISVYVLYDARRWRVNNVPWLATEAEIVQEREIDKLIQSMTSLKADVEAAYSAYTKK